MTDHPIFTESICRIRALLGQTGLDPLRQQVLERLVHSSGDPGLQPLLRFSEAACEQGLAALQGGAAILTDTAMAAAAVFLRRRLKCAPSFSPAKNGQGLTVPVLPCRLKNYYSNGTE